MLAIPLFRTARRSCRALFDVLAELGAARGAPPRDAREAAHRLASVIGAVARSHAISVTVHGEVPRGTALVVANHVSYLDPLAILPTCPAIPVSKGEVIGWPIVGDIGRALGVVFVRRADPTARVRALHRIHALLSSGVPVLNFPEGTTSRGARVLPFWRGTFGVAQRLGVPVVPLAIRYRDASLAWCDNETFLPHYLRMAGRSRVEIELAFGSPMQPRAHEPAEDMAARARNTIVRMLRSFDATTSVRVSAPRRDAVLSPARVVSRVASRVA
jgi:1-acyl-sn-glycerol-3-phosphate acyltransferase